MEEEDSRTMTSKKRARDRELMGKEWRRIVRVWTTTRPLERRYARMDELVRDELRAMRSTFKGLDRACGTNRWKAAAEPRVTFRLKGGWRQINHGHKDLALTLHRDRVPVRVRAALAS